MGGAPADRRRGESPVGYAKAVRLLFNNYETGDSMNKIYVFSKEHCVMCGAVIPEGRQVCTSCEQNVKAAPVQVIDWKRGIPAASLMCRIRFWLCGIFER